MVEASGADSEPHMAAMADEGENNAAVQLQWTSQLVSMVDKRLRASVTADELKKLSIENARPEFKKVL